MPDLGKKYECYNCRTKFYNLGRPDAICPKCGANQKDARSDDAPAPAPRPPRRSALMETIPDENQGEFGEESGGGGGDDEADDDDLEETQELGEAEPAAAEEEEEY